MWRQLWNAVGTSLVLLTVVVVTAAVTPLMTNNVVSGGEDDGTDEEISLTLRPQEVSLQTGEEKTFNLTLRGDLQGQCVNVSFELDGKPVATTPPPMLVCDSPDSYPVVLHTTSYGHATLIVHTDPPLNTSKHVFSTMSVMKNEAITITADVLGWLYTIAWDISFLPQIVHNWRRKSVIGLSFDYITFCGIGFSCYFLFNMGLLWIPSIQDQYYQRHPLTVLHVRLNDVIFPLYASLYVISLVIQCFIYERGPKQRVSIPCMIISSLLLLSAIIWLILVPTVDKLLWVDFLYWLSYISLVITAIKYTPQMYINCKLQSTEGWSIWQVLLDLAGGTLSLLQMFLLAANYDDWMSVLTDPSKLGMGLLSMLFNIFFIMQHYCLFRGAPVKREDEEIVEEGGDIDNDINNGCDNETISHM
ncbi:hypothetical protein Pmani_015776 [Petrolisthes manimaculis]|uniref:Cystinosin n=1 Tax=Petrolisthes manimaculis TaxID=1843537 RepID=A0AAE1UB89_9EUCA|nr:hypothetical protein Pmani_015776 [Petrolisthes manimaculis]